MMPLGYPSCNKRASLSVVCLLQRSKKQVSLPEAVCPEEVLIFFGFF
jgi:hypothetical protein